MKFDYFLFMTGDPKRPYHALLGEATDQVKKAESLGFEIAWTSEHHFGGEGFDIQPNPILTAAHLARYTAKIRLGFAAVILPEWHPLRLAEDIAFLDQSTAGRVECALGKGITNREISNLTSFDVDRRFPNAGNAIFRETLEILLTAWTTDSLRFDGNYYQFPRPGVDDSYAAWYPRNPAWRDENGKYAGINVVPKPYQKPHPRLWIVGDSTETFQTAAQYDLRPITWLRSRRALLECLELYRSIQSSRHGRDLRLGENCAVLRTCVIAPTRSQAREIAEPAVESMYRDYLGGLRGRSIYADPGEQLSDSENGQSWFDFLDDRGHLMVGTPDDVCEQIADLRDTCGLDRILLFMSLPGITHSDTMSSIQLFGEKVLPKFI